VALQLRRHGVRGVRPLLGGYQAWKDLGYPLETVVTEEQAAAAAGPLAANGAA